jgi:hypothetical protein
VLGRFADCLGVSLHRFAFRLRAPTMSEFAFWCRRLSVNKEDADKLINSWWKKLWNHEDHLAQPEAAARPRATSKPGIPADVLPGGWRGTGSFVRMRSRKGDQEQLLCGLAPLMAWVACGKSIDKIPPGGRRVVDCTHALWEVLEFIGEQTVWGAPARADVAALFATEVRKKLPAFQRALGLPQGVSNGTNMVLSKLCKVSTREIGYAIHSLGGQRNKSSAPTPRQQPRTSGTSTPSEVGRTPRAESNQRPRSNSPTLIRLGEASPRDLADLAIIELEFGELLGELRTRIKPEAIVAHIYNPEEGVENESSPRVLEFLNDPSQHGIGEPPFVLREKGFLLGRAVMIFSREDIAPPHHQLPSEDDRKKSALSGREGKRSCRTWIYKKLMETFCSGDARVVFAPLYEELGSDSEDQDRKEQRSVLDCLKKARRQGTRLVIYRKLVDPHQQALDELGEVARAIREGRGEAALKKHRMSGSDL